MIKIKNKSANSRLHFIDNYSLLKCKRSNSLSYFIDNYSLLKCKRSQITIFIIFGLMIVVFIALILVARNPPKTEVIDDNSPHAYIESCTKEAIQESIKIISRNGEINPELSVMYMNLNRTYLCYTSEFYKKCVNQRPKLTEHIEDQITEYITPKVSECFESLKSNLEKRYDIEMGMMKIKTKLVPQEIVVEINREFKMTRDEKDRDFEVFKVSLVHPMYDLTKISSEIVNQEAHFCTFDSLGFMIIYPDYDITRFKTGESNTMYNIKHRRSNQDFNFAIRSCVMPAGL